MKNLTLEQLKSYLGTGLKCYALGMYTSNTEFTDNPIPLEFEIVGANPTYVELHEEGRTINEEMGYQDIFPIMHSLSNLTKEIEHNGEKFVPLYELIILDKAFTTSYIEMFGIEECKYFIIEKLYEWHFDIYGLIEKGLAIDKNKI